MSELVPSIVSLDKGLNLQTAKLVAPTGSILNALNYEQVDFQGQKRIDGFVRYDGSALSVLDDYYKITLTDAFEGVTGDLVGLDDGLVGVVVGTDTAIIYVAIINSNLIPVVGDSLLLFATGGTPTPNIVLDVVTGVESGETIDDHYAKLLVYSQALRDKVESLPGGVIGLHWFRDRLYAVADVVIVSLSGIDPIIYPNDIIRLSDNGEVVKVLDSFVRANTRIVFIDSRVAEPWGVEGAEVTRDSISIGTIAVGFETIAVSEEIASFWQSRTEQQVLTEDGPAGPYDFGWKFIDQGWEVRFEDGISLYGSLPSLNQNIAGIGIQGPTSIVDNNGKALIITQKVVITDKNTQVNGWKDSQTPLTYVLDVDNLTEIDSLTIYADAYISWNGITTEVIASVDDLTEYPATNTIVIDY